MRRRGYDTKYCWKKDILHEKYLLYFRKNCRKFINLRRQKGRKEGKEKKRREDQREPWKEEREIQEDDIKKTKGKYSLEGIKENPWKIVPS